MFCDFIPSFIAWKPGAYFLQIFFLFLPYAVYTSSAAYRLGHIVHMKHNKNRKYNFKKKTYTNSHTEKTRKTTKKTRLGKWNVIEMWFKIVVKSVYVFYIVCMRTRYISLLCSLNILSQSHVHILFYLLRSCGLFSPFIKYLQ